MLLESTLLCFPYMHFRYLVVAGHVASLALVEVKSVGVGGGGGGTSPAGGRSTLRQRVEPGNILLTSFFELILRLLK